MKAKIEEPRLKRDKDRSSTSPRLPKQLRRSGIASTIIVPEDVTLPPEGALSPTERTGLALTAKGIVAEHPTLEYELELISVLRQIKLLH